MHTAPPVQNGFICTKAAIIAWLMHEGKVTETTQITPEELKALGNPTVFG